MTPTATSAVNGVTGKVTSGVLVAACLSTGTPIFMTPTVSLSVCTRPTARGGLRVLHSCNGRVVRPNANRLTDRLMKGKHVRRPRGVVHILSRFFSTGNRLRNGGVVVATKPACRGVSPIHFVNGCSSKGVKFTLTRRYTHHKTRIALVTKPIRLGARRSHVHHVSMRSTNRVLMTSGGCFTRTSTNVLYTTMTSFHPRIMTSGGVGHRGRRRLALRLRTARSVTTDLKTLGNGGRLLMNFTLRAGGRRRGTRKGLRHGGFSFVMLGSLGSTKTKFHCSAGGVDVVSEGNHASCPLGSGARMTRSVVSHLSSRLGLLVLGPWLSLVRVLHSLCVRGCTLVRGLSVDFRANFSIVANRAKTKGSVVLKTVNLLLKRQTSVGTVHQKTSGYMVRTHFSVSTCNVHPFFRRGRLRCSRRYVLHHRIRTSNGDQTFVGSAPTSLIRMGRLNRRLVSMRSRRRGLLLGGRKFRLGILSVLTRGSTTLRGCRSHCTK